MYELVCALFFAAVALASLAIALDNEDLGIAAFLVLVLTGALSWLS